MIRRLHAETQAIFQAAIAAVDPTHLVANRLAVRGCDAFVRIDGEREIHWPSPTLIIGAGKAAARMAAGCERALGVGNVCGEVIVADGCGADLQAVAVAYAGHPLPDERGERATRRLIHSIEERHRGGTLCLISGGASSLLVRPRPPVTLADKIRTTDLLLQVGADITEFNTVRKHLSEVKGGGLLRKVRTQVVTLVISDVVGDDPSVIGSGPTVQDATTFLDAWRVVERYELESRIPETVRDLLRSGIDGRIAETVKPRSTEARRCENTVIGSNRTALEGAADAAHSRGWNVTIESAPLHGDTTEAAGQFGLRLRAHMREARGLCVLAGGETTVQVKGTGKGGRNQEFALALSRALAGTDAIVLSAGSDGIDGPTSAAGAFVDGSTLQRARQRGLDPDAFLAANDSHTFFSQLGDLYECGPTGTNVMDIKIALLPSRSALSGDK